MLVPILGLRCLLMSLLHLDHTLLHGLKNLNVHCHKLLNSWGLLRVLILVSVVVVVVAVPGICHLVE